MCYHGSFGWRRPINLKLGAEIAGGYWLPNPLNRAFVYFRAILFIVILVVLVVDIATFSADEEEKDTVYAARESQLLLGLYVLYSLFVIVVSILALCKDIFESCLSNSLYYICSQILQACVSTMITLLLLYPNNLTMIEIIGFIIILIECFVFNLIQFHYFFGLILLYIINILFYFIFTTMNDNNDNIDNIFNSTFLIMLFVIHSGVTIIKRTENYHWFIRHNISQNILNKLLCDESETINKILAFGNGNDSNKFCTITFGSCADQTFSRMPSHQAMIQRNEPNVIVLAGDNIYGDLSPPTTTKVIYKCPCKNATLEESYNKLLNHSDFQVSDSRKNDITWLATWDDHDYGDNDAGHDYKHKYDSKNDFIKFLTTLNKNSDLNDNYIHLMKTDKERGVHYHYDYTQSLENNETLKIRFYMLDARFYRKEGKDMLGDEQWQWFENTFINGKNDSTIDWHIIVAASPILNEGPNGVKMIDDYTRKKIIKLIESNNLLNRTLMISGDIHYHVWHKYKELYEFTSSSMTHTKPWFFMRWKYYQGIVKYKHGATDKSKPSEKEGYGEIKINKRQWQFCVRTPYGYSFLHASSARGDD